MTEENLKKYIPVEQKLYWKAKNAGAGERKWMWKEYFNFRKNCLIMETLKVDSTPYRGAGKKGNPIVEVKKDLDFAYSLTIHKSQGRTYKSVFFDARDCKDNKKHYERNRLNYVALSRPTDIAYVNI
jgi:exodeoxyribonuclease-5